MQRLLTERGELVAILGREAIFVEPHTANITHLQCSSQGH